MPGPYTKGAQNAEALFALFDYGDVLAGSATINQNTTGVTITHGLAGTPTFFLFQTDDAGDVADRGVFASNAGATTFDIEHADTDGATQTVYYIAAVLSA